MTIKTIATVVLGATLLTATPAFSAVSSDIMVSRTSQHEPTGLYIGGAFGQADFDKVGDSDVGFAFYGGINPWDSIGFEFGYANFGKPSFSGGGTFETTMFRGGLIANHRINRGQISSGLAIFGQVGLSVWDADSTPLGAATVSESGTDIYFGLGGTKALSSNSSLRFAVDFYTLSDGAFDEDITFLSVGFQLSL